MDNLIYLVLAVVGFFVIVQVYARLSMFLKKGKKIEHVEGKLGREIKSGNRVLIYFYTNSCAACKPMTPVVDRLKKEFNNIHKVNLSQDMETGRRFGVMGTPATVLVEDGKISSFNLGAKNESYLRNLLSS